MITPTKASTSPIPGHRARFIAAATAGVAPRVMGIGPIFATRKLLARTGLSLADFDVIELNEAFSSQALATMRELGLPDDAAHVNPNGGAIALGHPLGMSGARLALTAALELIESGQRRALTAPTRASTIARTSPSGVRRAIRCMLDSAGILFIVMPAQAGIQ